MVILSALLLYPLPIIDDIPALFGNSANFSMLDLMPVHWQVALDEADREEATFTCHMRLYQFRVMPFELANVLGIFQQLMFVVGVGGI